jgi:hypothetical protein
MKYIAGLIMLLTLICQSQLYSQSGLKRYREQKKYSLKAEDLKAIQKDGKTSWTVKTTLTNRSHDTLFYFITTNCDPAYYAIDTMALFVDFKYCNTDEHTIIAVKPKGQRVIDLEISAIRPLTSSISFRIFMFIYKAKNRNDSIPHEKLMKTRSLMTVSNQIKT